MQKILYRIFRAGLPSEPAPSPDPTLRKQPERLNDEILQLLGRALAIRHVDAGSCNGCELEIHALGNVLYDLERFGLRFVASPRHADVLLVTGPVTTRMREPFVVSSRAWVSLGSGAMSGSPSRPGSKDRTAASAPSISTFSNATRSAPESVTSWPFRRTAFSIQFEYDDRNETSMEVVSFLMGPPSVT